MFNVIQISPVNQVVAMNLTMSEAEAQWKAFSWQHVDECHTRFDIVEVSPEPPRREVR